MKVLFIGRNARIGGGSTFRLNIGRGLIARGNEVALTALGGPMVARYREAGIRYHWCPPWTVCTSRLASIVRQEKPDLIHASNTTAGDAGRLASLRTGVPYLISLHNTITPIEAQHACLKDALRILVFDEGAAASAASYTDVFDPSRIVRLPRPVPHRPTAIEQLSPLRIAYVARLSARKGKIALSLLQAFEEFARENPGASLKILGDGTKLREVAAEGARVSRATGAPVEVLGQVIEPAGTLKGVGVVVGAGYAALEAIMQGRAVIGAGFKGYGLVTAEDVIQADQGNFGDTVGQWDMTAENFLTALRTLRQSWESAEGRERYWGLDRFLAPIHGIEGVAERLEAIYREVVSSA